MPSPHRWLTRWLCAALLAPLLGAGAAGEPVAGAAVEPNLELIGAPQAWAHGVTGQGVVVAVLDTGVDLSQPDLAARWRGGSNSWFDPYGQHPDQPVDLSGHGTQMLGVILGGAAGGTQVGVAPGARWIAARLFDDRGRATTAAIHAALRWVLDPDGDPATADAPQVVNNSWSSVKALCDPEFQPDLQALRAAGILPVFAAGENAPPSPASLPEAFAVGALGGPLTLAPDSAHGPTRCGAEPGLFPALVAPGVDIRTTDRDGLYGVYAGSSIAAAHVSGALALMLSAHPGLTADEQAEALRTTAVDLGETGPDNAFGYGRLDAGAAVASVRPAAAWVGPVMLALGALVILGLGALWSRQPSYRKAPLPHAPNLLD